jgi:hypothetical protein
MSVPPLSLIFSLQKILASSMDSTVASTGASRQNTILSLNNKMLSRRPENKERKYQHLNIEKFYKQY